MLLLEHRVFRCSACNRFTWLAGGTVTAFGNATRPRKYAVARFLPPPRQHERVNLQRVGHRLHLDARQLTELHSLEFELQAVLTDFHRTQRRGIQTPPSVRRKCLLYRGKIWRRLQARC